MQDVDVGVPNDVHQRPPWIVSHFLQVSTGTPYEDFLRPLGRFKTDLNASEYSTLQDFLSLVFRARRLGWSFVQKVLRNDKALRGKPQAG